MLEVTSLGSGSSGNAILIRTADTAILVDAGVGVRGVQRTLAASGLTLSDIDAVLISHEHSDHVRELPRFVASGTPIICTRGSALAANVPASTWVECVPDRPLQLTGMEIIAIPVSHDAAEPCGFLIRSRTGSLTILTDLGSPPPAAAEAFSESDLIVIEANHDETMVRRGPYPRHLQRRILSDSGHLSNTDCGDLIAATLRGAGALPTIWLAHLSRTNNDPMLARKTVARRMAHVGLGLDVQVLPRGGPSEPWRPGVGSPGVAQLSMDL